MYNAVTNMQANSKKSRASNADMWAYYCPRELLVLGIDKPTTI
jgi:hypothetical protein